MFRHRNRKRKKIGLALSGGSVRGAAHLGVLEVLEREGIRPDYVAGVSAGSAVGAVYCAGLDLDEIKRLALGLQWRKLGRVTRPRLGFFDGHRLEEYLEEINGYIYHYSVWNSDNTFSKRRGCPSLSRLALRGFA
jgi:NTE family protein